MNRDKLKQIITANQEHIEEWATRNKRVDPKNPPYPADCPCYYCSHAETLEREACDYCIHSAYPKALLELLDE